jgi:hypothetical protein
MYDIRQQRNSGLSMTVFVEFVRNAVNGQGFARSVSATSAEMYFTDGYVGCGLDKGIFE